MDAVERRSFVFTLSPVTCPQDRLHSIYIFGSLGLDMVQFLPRLPCFAPFLIEQYLLRLGLEMSYFVSISYSSGVSQLEINKYMSFISTTIF